jgi:hypothetical protein
VYAHRAAIASNHASAHASSPSQQQQQEQEQQGRQPRPAEPVSGPPCIAATAAHNPAEHSGALGMAVTAPAPAPASSGSQVVVTGAATASRQPAMAARMSTSMPARYAELLAEERWADLVDAFLQVNVRVGRCVWSSRMAGVCDVCMRAGVHLGGWLSGRRRVLPSNSRLLCLSPPDCVC